MINHFDKNAWENMTVFEQMGNIGSEVGRALKAKHHGDEFAMQGALYRGLDLIDYTSELWSRSKSPRTKELLRARELFASSVLTNEEDSGLEDYFFQFALVARGNK